MHAHDHDRPERDPLRPRSRVDSAEDDATFFRAAVAGRPDVLGADGMLRMQRAVGNSAVQRIAEAGEDLVSAVVGRGGGMPLGGPVREDMESRFDTDFSDVRVHTDADAHASAKSVGAHAYTVGTNIVFQRGAYAPESHAGRTMLAHELTHVVQQRSGPVDGTPMGNGVKVSDPGDRFEQAAAANAERIVAMPAPAGPAATGVTGVHRTDDGARPSVQREGEEEELQGAFESAGPIQRAAEEEELQGAFESSDPIQRHEGEEELG